MPYRHIPAWMRGWFLPGLATLTVLALAGATFAIIRAGEIQTTLSDQREKDRLTTDFESCERGNRTRAAIKDIADANVTMWEGVRDDLPMVRFRAQLEENLAVLEAATEKLQGPIDCRAAVAGTEENRKR